MNKDKAFPVPANAYEYSDGSRADGMELRDYLAAHVNPYSSNGDFLWLDASSLVSVFGSPPEFSRETAAACLQFWLRVDAELRYRHADAMLEARKRR